MKTVTFTRQQCEAFDPITFTNAMLDAGFKFDHIGCPFKITKPWDRVENLDGSVQYRQWSYYV